MIPEDIEKALEVAFEQCETIDRPLTRSQKQILRQALGINRNGGINPLLELTSTERSALLRFIQEQTDHNQGWKLTLLNDWLHNRNSGAVQFIRDRYGMQWLDRVNSSHLAEYAELDDTLTLLLKVGDRVEVCNGLWEWVQDNGPCGREWFPCTVIGIQDALESAEGMARHASCVVRFESGAEYEIQGIYEWNRPNWRWMQE